MTARTENCKPCPERSRRVKTERKRPPDGTAFGRVVELFSGVQGEGIHVGERHIFLRLAGCNLACRYCDQPEARRIPRLALIEQTPGRRDFTSTPNPIPAADLARAVLALHHPRRLHRALAVTGGEPLLQADFLADLLPRLRRRGLRVLLETNGALPDALRALLPCLDIVSMDLKLRSATGRPMPARAHEKFLRLAIRRGIEVYAKAVVTSSTTLREIGRAAALIARVKKSVPLVLQPVCPPSDRRNTRMPASGTRPPGPDDMLRLQETAARFLYNVRVIPQTHKIMGQR